MAPQVVMLRADVAHERLRVDALAPRCSLRCARLARPAPGEGRTPPTWRSRRPFGPPGHRFSRPSLL